MRGIKINAAVILGQLFHHQGAKTQRILFGSASWKIFTVVTLGGLVVKINRSNLLNLTENHSRKEGKQQFERTGNAEGSGDAGDRGEIRGGTAEVDKRKKIDRAAEVFGNRQGVMENPLKLGAVVRRDQHAPFVQTFQPRRENLQIL